MEIDTLNKFFVGAGGKGIVFMKPVPATITTDDALLLAAYLVSMAEHEASHDFSEVLKAVEGA